MVIVCEEGSAKAEELKRLFYENFNYYMDAKDRKQADLARYFGVTEATVSHWSTGKNFPRMKMIARIAVWLDIEPHALLSERQDDQEAEDDYLNDKTRLIADDLINNPDLLLLMRAAIHARPEGLKIATDMLREMQDKELHNGDDGIDEIRNEVDG